MRRLTLLAHLRRRSLQLQEDWVRAAGVCYLLEQGFTRDNVTTSLLPEPIFEDRDQELSIRKREVESLRSHIDELEETIQELGALEGTPDDEVEMTIREEPA